MQHYRRKPLNLTSNLTSLNSVSPRVAVLPERSGTDPIDAPTDLVQQTIEEAAPDALMADPAALVQRAASILEEEMAAGAQAAQQGTPEDTMLPSLNSTTDPGGILKNIHTFIDQFAQVLAQRPLPMNGLTPSLDPMAAANILSASNSLPLLRSPHPVQVGELVNLVFKIHNDSDQPVMVRFLGTDLWSSAGDRIPSSAMTFMPQNFPLEPDETKEVKVGVKVPPGTPANHYSGLAIASDLSDLAAAILLAVT
jgi:hypothetical protein